MSSEKQISSSKQSMGSDSLAGFILKMQKEDTRRRRLNLTVALSLFPLGLFYLIYGKIGHPSIELLGFGFLLAITYMIFSSFTYRKFTYAEPVFDYLRKASTRYKYWTLRRALIALPIVMIMGFAGGWTVWLTAIKYFGTSGIIISLLLYVCFFTGLCTFALMIEYVKWKKETAPILLAIQNHLEQLSN